MNSIELRSEKVRSIIGKIPPRIVRSGTLVLFIVFALLIIGSYFFPYSETITIPVQIKENKTLSINLPSQQYVAIAYVPINLQSKVIKGQEALVEIEGYGKNTNGQIDCYVQNRMGIAVVKNNKKYILFNLSLNNSLITSNGKSIPYYSNMLGTGKIILKKERLLNFLFDRTK